MCLCNQTLHCHCATSAYLAIIDGSNLLRTHDAGGRAQGGAHVSKDCQFRLLLSRDCCRLPGTSGPVVTADAAVTISRVSDQRHEWPALLLRSLAVFRRRISTIDHANSSVPSSAALCAQSPCFFHWDQEAVVHFAGPRPSPICTMMFCNRIQRNHKHSAVQCAGIAVEQPSAHCSVIALRHRRQRYHTSYL